MTAFRLGVLLRPLDPWGAPVASSILITYDKMSGPVLILISLGHDELATDAENEVMT
jgi:hypothetical protein